jgi:uncharacterized protein YeaO (DUF488 family)
MESATHNPQAASAIQLKRAYEEAEAPDGVRVLVDRLWPRGVAKSAAHLDAWMKELGPSDELRTWFGHRQDRWNSFQERYQAELRTPLRQLLLSELQSIARTSTLTLVYGARDTHQNEAVVLREYLLGHPPLHAGTWTGDLRLLVTLAVLAAAHKDAGVSSSTLQRFLAPPLSDREFGTSLQALQDGGKVRPSPNGWQLTARGLKQVGELSNSGQACSTDNAARQPGSGGTPGAGPR